VPEPAGLYVRHGRVETRRAMPSPDSESRCTMIDLAGKRALVTGGASGIGSASAGALEEAGARVVRVDLADGEGWLRHDVADDDGARAAVSEAVEALGGLDVLVNCAGVAGRGAVTEIDCAEWDRVMRVNVRSIFCMSRHAIPVIAAGGGGSIVNIASQLGLVGVAASAAYCASKGAVINLTRAMAIDHAGDRIRVNAVCPGPIQTPMLDGYFAASPDPAAERRRFEDALITGRIGDPAEIAAAVAFLASDASSYVVGEAFVVDGGYVAG
jgi:NAD(P)-dependent dehydrogenase (short-subunit alcohol dehydrogenase family)